MIQNSWFHVEANVKDDIFDRRPTGDSEADAISSDDHRIICDDDHPMLSMADEDDAQSCSCDSFDQNPSADEVLNDLDDRDDDHRYDDREDEEGEEEEEEECSSVDNHHQRWSGETVGMPLMGGHQLKSTASVDSTKEFELLNEVEKSRLFWETCLAS
ncbi:hypothetical protein D8674_022768 [Pyrus ussuriensis x Pyrus communis]|uniref:Uncharacterized protein n=1 Tax=Pyrus ussuriensis x Pyrus communis TaxID=2448454 RepID=A0A5N5GSI4_9ROSA|nr:hypothetical protein D8674_022768 [Pyrus ussuriensis x Pyrus communis]